MSFVHLHNHSHYSTLDGLSKPENMIKRAKKLGQKAMAITDHGNMMGVIDFFKQAKKHKIKPLIGAEVYLTYDRKIKIKGDKRFHLVLIAKNETGYKNLVRLVTEANITGFYTKPRIDHQLLKEHSEGLIGLSACLAGEIPSALLEGDREKAKEAALRYKGMFGKDNFYLELQHHPDIAEQEKVNKEMISLSSELDIGLVATNDSHYVNKDDDEIQDALICINTGKLLEEKHDRLCMLDGDYSILSTEEMHKHFKDVPEALENTVKISEMCDLEIKFGRNLLPDYKCPDGMTEDEYLRKLCMKGLEKRYGIVKDTTGNYSLLSGKKEKGLPIPVSDIIDRMDFELEVVSNMGFPGYFLIVQDFVNWAKSKNILVGPGRGSAAGSIISFLTGITNVDPLRFGLLFERFLNPDRISMPDIDIDFQDDKRDMVLEYVREKYGDENVSQVVTYQTMGAKNSIRDIGRVMNVPLNDVNRISNLISSRPGTKIKDSLKEKELKEVYNESPVIKELIDKAMKIEGTIRGTGTHACAVIISGIPLKDIVPLQYPPREHDTVITQFEGGQLDDIGLLKMDFLGLRNLTIISKTLEYIKMRSGLEIDIDRIPFDDKKTYRLYSKAKTNGIFQFESPGMKSHLKELKPNRLDDLVAMNALYRPGPMQYIPDFIERKHKRKPIVYDHPLMEKYLKDTYGITVYQEQVMLLARELAGFTRGESDNLRKAMGKKIKSMMNELKEKFFKGCLNNEKFVSGFKPTRDCPDPGSLSRKIWSDWESFAEYAFNKSHSVCYAYVSYQTAYLKAHYPVEYMSAMLNSVRDDSGQVLKYIEECESMKIRIVQPDVNHSLMDFAPTGDGKVAFGLLAIKNVGVKAIETIIETREKSGPYKNIYDFLERVDISKANRRTIEHLARAGALDSLGHHRSQVTVSLDVMLPHFQQVASKKLDWGMSLFGESSDEELKIDHPPLPDIPEWDKSKMLEDEKELIGFYISGHPLDDYKDVLRSFSVSKPLERDFFRNDETVTIGGMLRETDIRLNKKGREWARLHLLTMNGDVDLPVFSKSYEKFKDILNPGEIYFLKGKVSTRNGDFTIYINEIKNYEQASMAFSSKTQKIRIDLKPARLDETTVRDFLSYLQKNKGDKDLYFRIVYDDRAVTLKSDSYKVSGTPGFVKGLSELLGEESIEIS